MPLPLERARGLSPLALPNPLLFDLPGPFLEEWPGVVTACLLPAIPFRKGQKVIITQPPIALPFWKGQGLLTAYSPLALSLVKSQRLVNTCLPLPLDLVQFGLFQAFFSILNIPPIVFRSLYLLNQQILFNHIFIT